MDAARLSYQELLNDPRWKERRKEIIKRDQCKCRDCEKQQTLSYYDHRLKCHVHLQPSGLIKVTSFFDREGNFGTRNESELIQTSKSIILHVHHRYYVENNNPWEYPDNALITLCEPCHQKIHNTRKILVFTDKTLTQKIKFNICTRCNGSGKLSQFKHVENGVCFKCKGQRYFSSKTKQYVFELTS